MKKLYKICTKCNLKKNISAFYKMKNGKYGVAAKCKLCTNLYKKEYRKNNPEVYENYKKLNKDKILKYQKEYRISNKDKITKTRLENKEKESLRLKKYYVKNRETIIKKSKIYKNKQYKHNTLFRLSDNIKSLIKYSLRKNDYKKDTKTFNILGCTFEEFKDYLEDNPYGFKINDKDLDLDHIIPISKGKNKKEIIKLNHYTNFQLLPSFYNKWVKIDKEFDRDHFEEWLKNNINN